MKTYLCAATAAALLISSPAWAQTASHTQNRTVTTTSNGKVTSVSKSQKTAACRNEKGVFIKCVSTVKTSAAATITRDSAGKCRFAAGPKKGQFTKCP